MQCPRKNRNSDSGVHIIWTKIWFWMSRSSGRNSESGQRLNHLEEICIWTASRSSRRGLGSGGDPDPLVFRYLEMVQILIFCIWGKCPDSVKFAYGEMPRFCVFRIWKRSRSFWKFCIWSAQTLWSLPLGKCLDSVYFVSGNDSDHSGILHLEWSRSICNLSSARCLEPLDIVSICLHLWVVVSSRASEGFSSCLCFIMRVMVCLLSIVF